MEMHKAKNQQEKQQHLDQKGKRSKRADFGGMIRTSSKKDMFKVVYISTPMKVTICASKFREIVQQLTGPDSDVARFMESCNAREYLDSSFPDDYYHGH